MKLSSLRGADPVTWFVNAVTFALNAWVFSGADSLGLFLLSIFLFMAAGSCLCMGLVIATVNRSAR